jgi:nitrogen fixation protein NifU and related proteins
MSELRDLYQEVILDHGRRPRNFGPLPDASHRAEGHNPFCGDKVTVFLSLEDGRVANVRFDGSGCAISIASASLMTDAIKGKSEVELRAMFDCFQIGMTAKDDDDAAEALSGLDKLAVFAGVREFPIRVKCATLPWHTLVAALDGATAPVRTE